MAEALRNIPEKWKGRKEDEKIKPTDVLFYQPHITKNSLIFEMLKYKRDDDSVDDFETVANRDK